MFNEYTVDNMVGKAKRLNRIFSGGKSLITPLDDSLISGPNIGLDVLEEKLKNINKGLPSGILAYPGTLKILSRVNMNIPTILNVTASTSLSTPNNKIQVFDVKKAVALGCDGVAIHINFSSKFEGQMLKNFKCVSEQCEEYGVPLMVIAYPRKEVSNNISLSDDYLKWKECDNDKYTEIVSHCVRASFELGADIIKTHYTGSKDSFTKIVNAASGVPVLISGGRFLSEFELFTMCRNAIDAGASGACIGRNVFSRKNSEEIISLLKDIIFNNLSVAEATNKLREENKL